MPTIPGNDLGYALPQLQRGSPSDAGITAGADAIARLAQTGAEIAETVRQNRLAVETAKATTDALNEIDEQKRFYRDEDKDYTTQEERYGKFYNDLLGRYQKRFKGNRQAYDEFYARVDRYALSAGRDIKSLALNKDMDNQRNVAKAVLSDMSGIAIRGNRQHYNEVVAEADSQIDEWVKTGVFEAGEGELIRSDFKNGLSRGKVRQDINRDPVTALENIRANKYESLSAEEQSQFEAAALSAIEQNKNKIDFELKNQYKELLSDTTLSYEQGFTVSDKEYQSALKAAKELGDTYVEDLEVARAASKYMRLPRAARDKLPDQLAGVNNAELRKALEDANSAIEAELDKDAYSFAVRQRIIDHVDIDLTDPSTLSARIEQAEYLKQHYGRDISPLTEFEADRLVEALPMMTPDNKVALATAFGTSEAIWQQLDRKNSSLFAMVGAIGDPDIMRGVFKGQQLVADGLIKLPEDRETLLQVFDDEVSDIYIGKDRKAMFDASVAYYASISGQSGWFVDNSFEDAIQAVSGGIGTINGGKVELPRSVDEDAFEDYIDDFSAKMVDRFGGVWSMDSGTAAKKIQGATIRNVGNNRYIALMEGYVLMARDGARPFEFSYDPELIEIERQGGERRARRQR